MGDHKGGAAMLQEDSSVDAREYGELIATVKHLTGTVESLQQQYATESAKLHARLDEMFRSMVPRHEHDKLAADVRGVWEYSRKTRSMLDTNAAGTKEGMRWQERLMFTIVGAVVSAALLAAKVLST